VAYTRIGVPWRVCVRIPCSVPGGNRNRPRGVAIPSRALLLLLCLGAAFPSALSAETWARTYGGGCARSIVETLDGGFVVTGSIIPTEFGPLDSDLRVLKIDARGEVEWDRSYGGEGYDYGTAILPAPDGGYVVAGNTTTFTTTGYTNPWVLKLDARGVVEWQRTVGVPAEDSTYALRPAPDGGWYVAGRSYQGDNVWHPWVLRLDAAGDILWRNRYALGEIPFAWSGALEATSDGGLLLAAEAGDLYKEIGLVRLDDSGRVLWHRSYGVADSADISRWATASASSGPTPRGISCGRRSAWRHP